MEGFKLFIPLSGLMHFTSTNPEMQSKVVSGKYKYEVEQRLIDFWNANKKDTKMRSKIVQYGLYEVAMRDMSPKYRELVDISFGKNFYGLYTQFRYEQRVFSMSFKMPDPKGDGFMT